MRFIFRIGAFLIAGCCIYAQTAKPPETTRNELDMEFVKIPPGEFMMGCSPGDKLCKAVENPAHRVRITKNIEMGRYEVTQAQYRTLSADKDQSEIKGDKHPVEMVTKAEAIDFLNKLTAKNDGYRYRLPTEAEWEYAARAGSTAERYGSLNDIAWWQENSDDTSHPVGGKKPNAWGLHDMLGNVREWTNDTFYAPYYASSPVDDPPGAPANTGERGQPGYVGGAGVALPVIRGGGWDNPADAQRVSDRYHYFGPTLRMSDLGFRAVRERIAQ